MMRGWRQARSPGIRLVLLVACTAACARGRGRTAASIPEDAAASDAAAAALIAPSGADVGDGGEPRQVDRIRIVVPTEPSSLDPEREPDVWSRRIAFDAIYEPLVRELPDGSIEPMLAERWTIDDEGQRYLFHLRSGVRFHDGKLLTSVDVASTLDRVRSSRTRRGPGRNQAGLADIDRVELAGRWAVRLELRRPSPRLLETLAQIAILPERSGPGDPGRAALDRHPIGTGPLKLREWQKHQIELARNDRYWGQPAGAASIEIAVQPDGARALLAARRGEVDLLAQVAPIYLTDQIETPAIAGRYEAVRVHVPRVAFVLWNPTHPPLDDPAVRRSLSLAVDRRRLLDEARHGLGRPLVTVPAGEGAEVEKGDPRRAAAALLAAGLVRSAGGLRTASGRSARITLLVPSGSHEVEIAARMVADAIGRAGVPVELAPADFSTVMARIRRGAYDAALLEWTGVDDDDIEPLVGSRGSFSPPGYDASAVDRLLDALRAQPRTGAGYRDARARLAAAVADAAPALFLYGADELHLVSRRLRMPSRLADFFRLRELAPK